MSPSALLLALGSIAGVLCGRALDGLGLLPGVHESDQVRTVTLSPSWTVAGVAACLLLGPVVEAALRRSRLAGVLLLVGGQLLVLSAPELAGRAGDAHDGGAPLYAAIGVQLALSLLTVTTALVVRRFLLVTVPAPAVPAPPRRDSDVPTEVAAARLLPGGVRGRAPPQWLRCLAPHSPTS